jgi:RTX calcium-binding nonapeptide repeat (4 copies)
MFGGLGNDTLVGGTGTNLMDGGPGNDSLTAGPSADSIYGGLGNDTLVANANTAVIGDILGVNTMDTVATLTGSAGSGIVDFGCKQGSKQQPLTLDLTISGSEANSTLNVSVAGVQIGQITTDANGNGELQLGGTSGHPFPKNFPVVAKNSPITVVDASGTTVLSGTLLSNLLSNNLEAAATLTGSVGSGTLEYEFESTAPQLPLVFDLNITGSEISSTLNVLVAGVQIGQITTDTNGDGQLQFGGTNPFPKGFPVVAKNSPITVVDASGTTVLSGTLVISLA